MTLQERTYITYQLREHSVPQCPHLYCGNKRVSTSCGCYELIYRKHLKQCPAHSKPSINISCYHHKHYMWRQHHASCFPCSILPDDDLGRRESGRPGFKFCLGYLLLVWPWESHLAARKLHFPHPCALRVLWGCSESMRSCALSRKHSIWQSGLHAC